MEVEKLKCVDHIQKRVGNRLRNLKKNVKDLGGRGKITNNVIDCLQNYFGIAVRSNVGDLEDMNNGICASLFHVASSEDNNYHSTYCPLGENSWCKFQRDISLRTSTYKPGCGLPLNFIKYVKPIFNDLSQESLLRKCLHGKTQNQNESYNALIWERLPKGTYVSITQLRLGSYDAVAHFKHLKPRMILPNAFSSNKRKPTKRKLIVDDQSDTSSDDDKFDDDDEELDDNEYDSNSEGERTDGDGVVRKPTIGDYYNCHKRSI